MRLHLLSWSSKYVTTCLADVSISLSALFDNCIAWHRLVRCSVTRSFLPLQRVWLARLANRLFTCYVPVGRDYISILCDCFTNTFKTASPIYTYIHTYIHSFPRHIHSYNRHSYSYIRLSLILFI